MIQNITSKNYACCSFCNSKFYYDENDLIDVDEKHYGFICPECGNEIIVKERKICSFPDSFFKFGTKDTRRLTNEEIQKMIDNVRFSLENSEDEYDYSYGATGDTMVFGIKEEGKYFDIYVAKNYWHDCYELEN